MLVVISIKSMNPVRIAIATTLTATLCIATASSTKAQTPGIEPTDLDSLRLGSKIEGPVGPEVETSFVNTSGNGVGDLSSSVSCPREISDNCTPSENPLGTLYTYVYEVTPGVDLPNDEPFPQPNRLQPFERVESFQLNFPAVGFNGVAGYSFSEAEEATEEETLVIEISPDGSLIWRLPPEVAWEDGETISFFWQTTQPPVGPNGSYGLAGDGRLSGAVGPLPSTEQ